MKTTPPSCWRSGASLSAAETARDIAARIPALMLGGDLLGSLEHVHRAIRAEPGTRSA